MMESKNRKIYYILFLIFLLLIVGCTKNQTTTISVSEYNRLKTIETQYINLSQKYIALQKQYDIIITQRDNISNILYNQLKYDKQIKIYNPLELKMQVLDYPTPAKMVTNTVYGAFIIDFILALGFFIAEIRKSNIWKTSIILVTLLLCILLLMLNQII